MFVIKFAECLMEGKELAHWVVQARMNSYRLSLSTFLWAHAMRKTCQNEESDLAMDTTWDELDM